MAFSIRCPGCESSFNVAENLIGKTIKCNKCGEMVTVKAPAAAKATAAAKPTRAAVLDDDDDVDIHRSKPTRRRDDDDEPVRAKASRSRDDDDDFDDRPRKKGAKAEAGKSKAPLLIGGLVAVLVLGGGAGAYFAFFNDKKDTAQNSTTQPTTAPVTPGAGKADEGEKKGDEGAKAADGTGEKGSDSGEKKSDPPMATPTGAATAQIPATPATGNQQPPLTSNDYMTKLMAGIMDDITLTKVKRSSVMIECVSKNGGAATGSGWFGLEPNIVITNAHVIDMIAPGSPEPAKLTIFVYSGERGQTPGILQRDIPHNRIKIIGVDRLHDLAVLKIIGEKDLPPPLMIRPTADLRERQGITVCGFPLGYLPGNFTGTKKQPQISIRPSTVTAVRYDDDGLLSKLQVEGGIYGGNSGGPIVDAEGFVIGVVVSGISRGSFDTQIAFAVPTEYVAGIMSGQIMEVEYEQPYLSGEKVKVPVKVTCADPLDRLRKVGISTWIGDTNVKVRPPGPKQTGAQPSDKNLTQVELKYDGEKKIATGEITFAQAPPGQSYWVQPYYTNTKNPNYWMAGKPLPMSGPPVERVATALNFTVKSGTIRPIELTTISTLDEFFEGEGESNNKRILERTKLKGTERILDRDRNDQRSVARIRLTYDDVEVKGQQGLDAIREGDVLPPQILLLLKQGLNKLESFAFIDRTGEVFKFVPNTLAVDNLIVRILAPMISNEAMEALMSGSVPMPNRTVQPLESWTISRTHVQPLPNAEAQVREPTAPGRPSTSKPQRERIKEIKYIQELTYTYLGVRTRGGKREAVIKVTGKALPAAGSAKESVSGTIKGFAFVDTNGGVVLQAEIEKDIDLDTSEQGFKKKASLLEKIKVVRGGQTN
jgi:S1-C subfamily serine protease